MFKFNRQLKKNSKGLVLLYSRKSTLTVFKKNFKTFPTIFLVYEICNLN